MTKSPEEKIHDLADVSSHAIAGCRAVVAERVTAGHNADSIGKALQSLAEAEGTFDFWSRLSDRVENFASNGKEFTKTDAMKYAMDVLARGADDTWSGRGNDVNRSRFDGVRNAAQNLEYIF
jgi:hypothetical protein